LRDPLPTPPGTRFLHAEKEIDPDMDMVEVLRLLNLDSVQLSSPLSLGWVTRGENSERLGLLKRNATQSGLLGWPPSVALPVTFLFPAEPHTPQSPPENYSPRLPSGLCAASGKAAALAFVQDNTLPGLKGDKLRVAGGGLEQSHGARTSARPRPSRYATPSPGRPRPVSPRPLRAWPHPGPVRHAPRRPTPRRLATPSTS
jgi:hypothetical protein